MVFTFANCPPPAGSSKSQVQNSTKNLSREVQLGEAAGGAACGASDVAGAGVRAGFGAACFLAAATAGDAEAAGRGDGLGVAAGAAAACELVVVGSAVMMLTGGVEAALGNSALVGLPVGTPGMSAATGGTAATTGAGVAFHASE